jgi:hypothetical protein
MAMRMEDRLQSAVSVPDGPRSAVFPSMMLQTLVENAIRHGLEPRAEGGRLEIRAGVVDGQLSVQVGDTGMGFAPNSKGGVGLANMREQIAARLREAWPELEIAGEAANGREAVALARASTASPTRWRRCWRSSRSGCRAAGPGRANTCGGCRRAWARPCA